VQPNTLQSRDWEPCGLKTSLSTGQQLLENVGEKKYCKYVNCQPKKELFNPLDPNSPYITMWNEPSGFGDNCIPVCGIEDPSTIDQDPVMNRMLANPEVAPSTLIKICQGDTSYLNGTKIGRFCQNLKQQGALRHLGV
jgi:hypothetical protein